jgi:hypothetical protein
MANGDETSGSDVLREIKAWRGTWRGRGINHENESFDGVLVAREVFGTGVLLWFRASGTDGTVYHEEVGLLGSGVDGRLTLATANTNLNFVQRFDGEAGPSRVVAVHHGDQASEQGFRETLTLRLEDDGGLTVAFAWAMPGEGIRERSAVTLSRVDTPPPDSSPVR